MPCGPHQYASFYQLDCACKIGYPGYRRDNGELACHDLAFNQVFIADQIRLALNYAKLYVFLGFVCRKFNR